MKVCSVCQRCYEDSAVSCPEDDRPLSEARRGSCKIIAGYRLDFLLETSGNIEIFRARQIASGQTCLVKILAADQSENSRQFLHEAKIAAALFHPNVTEVYDAGVLESGETFVVAEEAEGQTLRELLDTAGVTLVKAIQVARQTAEALHAVHLQGLTHRAVNPANIILTTGAEHRLLVRIQNFDFGGVNERFITSSRFVSGSALNSLKYFAPEQCAGAAASAQTDVYGLGIVFYEMLAGAPPFDAPKAALLIEKQKNEPPPEIKINNFDLRMLLTHTLMEALRKPSRLRHNSANAFARQLRHIEQLATHSPTPPPAMVVAPPAPPKSATDAPPLKTFHIQPAAVETPTEIFQENYEPAAAEFENKPAAAVQAESEPVINLEIPEMDLPERQETAELLSEEPVIENYFVEEASAPVQYAAVTTEIPQDNFLPAEPPQSKVIRAESPETSVVPVQGRTTLIEWTQPEGDIPSETETAEIQFGEQPIEPADRQGAARFATQDFLPDEDFSMLPEENEFVSAFMRNAGKSETLDPQDSILPFYGALSGYGFAADHRLLFVGGFVGLLVLFLAAYALIRWDVFGEPVTAKTVPAQKKSLPPKFEPADGVSPARQNSLKDPETVLPAEDGADIDQLRPLPADAPPPLSREKSTVTAAAKPGVRNPAPAVTPGVNRTAEKPPVPATKEEPFVPSTIVIFSENGKIKSKVETANKSAAGKPPAATNQNDDFTRQRVVENPKP